MTEAEIRVAAFRKWCSKQHGTVAAGAIWNAAWAACMAQAADPLVWYHPSNDPDYPVLALCQNKAMAEKMNEIEGLPALRPLYTGPQQSQLSPKIPERLPELDPVEAHKRGETVSEGRRLYNEGWNACIDAIDRSNHAESA